MTKTSKISLTVKQHIKQSSITCTSMIVTIFGDIVSQHGSWLWLSSLIKVLEPLGFNERQVRTSVYRLVQNKWLQGNKVGRCSYYCFTDFAMAHYEKAARRIYAADQADWNGNWILVLPISIPDDKKEEFRKSLLWQGFNTLVSGLYAHPSCDASSLDEAIHELGLAGNVIVLNGSVADLNSQSVMKALIKDRWELSELETSYRDFLSFYRPICQKLLNTQDNPEQLSTTECFLLRAILIHDYRRVLLRDPDFPQAMLTQGWVGYEAHDLVKRMYKVLSEPSTVYIQENMNNAQGKLPEANSKFYQRFVS
ncbi:MAG: PaaX family transcriptional regulator C-terminal domain-containing protein [Colwellia sp.]|nr:PaaX family transcriptional regulator C-terminal domain-containing protein [Colwellia sp.]